MYNKRVVYTSQTTDREKSGFEHVFSISWGGIYVLQKSQFMNFISWFEIFLKYENWPTRLFC